jgi:hypothetical protein
MVILMRVRWSPTSKMDHHIRRSRNWSICITRHVKMACQGIENLSGIREVCLESIDIGGRVWERHEIQIQDFMAFAQKVRDHMSPSFATPSCKYLESDQPFLIENSGFNSQSSSRQLQLGPCYSTSLNFNTDRKSNLRRLD